MDQLTPPATTIHPLAVVEPGAVIHQGATIGPWCHVGPEVEIGVGTTLLSHVVVAGRTRIGEHCVLYPFASVGLSPQDLKYRGEPTETDIGPRTQIREHVTIHRGTVTGAGITRIGADCLLMAVVHVAHDCQLGQGVIVANNVVMGGHVTIGDTAVIGGASALHQFVRIGRGAMVGGASGVEADVVPFATVLGNRARLAGLNVVGLRRRGVGHAELHELRAAFRTLFLESGDVFAERLKVLESRAPAGAAAELLAFIKSPSRRGLIRGAMPAEATEEG